MRAKLLFLVALVLVIACSSTTHPLNNYEPVDATTVVMAPSPDQSNPYDPVVTRHGKYLVELLGCGACHTDGALIGAPRTDRLLAGSSIGLAHSNPLQLDYPAIVFPSNLTPDKRTGIGHLSDRNLAKSIRGGAGRHGVRSLRVMPVAAYSQITDDDVASIVAYLRSLAPVEHQVPNSVSEGQKTDKLYVHFGVYRSRKQ